MTVVPYPVPVRFPFESYVYDSDREPVTVPARWHCHTRSWLFPPRPFPM